MLFSHFLALMMVRVPNYRRNIEGISAEVIKRMAVMTASYKEGFDATIKRYEKDTGKSLGDPEELRRSIQDEEGYDIKISPEFSLKMFLNSAAKFAGVFNAMTWTFFESTPDWKFVTSDNPLYYDDPTHDPKAFYGVGLAHKNVEVSFPISRDLALIATWGKVEGGYWKNKEAVKALTRRTVISAQRFIYASEKSDALNRLVQKHIDSSPKWRVG